MGAVDKSRKANYNFSCLKFSVILLIMQDMQKRVKRVLVLTVGIIFIILGFFGLVLPFLQGILFLIIGFILVSLCSPKIRLSLKRHLERHPHLFPLINKVEAWIVKFIGEI